MLVNVGFSLGGACSADLELQLGFITNLLRESFALKPVDTALELNTIIIHSWNV
jgi:hypothetical protein